MEKTVRTVHLAKTVLTVLTAQPVPKAHKVLLALMAKTVLTAQ
jgi:hypothetical protein